MRSSAAEENPLVSVIIPTFNRSSQVVEAVQSVLEQTYRPLEIIVVDDGSTDGTREHVAAYSDRCTLLSSKENRGVSAARNRGIRKSCGQFVALLDSDDLWLPDKLAHQIAFFRRHPQALICQTEEIWMRRGVRVNPRKIHRKYSGHIFSRCLPLCIVSPSAVMIKRELFDLVGLFDEQLPACEDYDLWLRIAAQHPIFLVRQPLIVKRGGHEDQLSRTVLFLDRYRIQSLCKLLQGARLTPEQWWQAAGELQKKAAVYCGGCRKRGKTDEADRVDMLVNAALKMPDSTR
ncbi:MAG: glycosyltransferase [Deltaproteobacteria bacterium]|nr:glycosyltransferase [Candidatus Anaeroferrophillus wilburensis]MBN2889068.1 glycosyltransferase [Deltaproteobacteria bacterium]